MKIEHVDTDIEYFIMQKGKKRKRVERVDEVFVNSSKLYLYFNQALGLIYRLLRLILRHKAIVNLTISNSLYILKQLNDSLLQLLVSQFSDTLIHFADSNTDNNIMPRKTKNTFVRKSTSEPSLSRKHVPCYCNVCQGAKVDLRT